MMASEADSGRKDDGQIFLTEWKRIPEKNFLSTLTPGSRYILRTNKVLRLKLKAKLEEISIGKLSGPGMESRTPMPSFVLAEQSMELGKELVETVSQLMEEINQKIDDLEGIEGGGEDRILEEMFDGLEGLLYSSYDIYNEVPLNYWRQSTREFMMIDVESAPGLLYKDDLSFKVPRRPGPKSARTRKQKLVKGVCTDKLKAAMVKKTSEYDGLDR